MYFLVAKQACEVAVKLSEIWIKILINDIVSSSNDFLITGKYGLSSRKEKRALFLDGCMQFVKSFYFDSCKLLNANAFLFMYDKFEPNFHYYANTLKIINKPYLDYCSRKYSNCYAKESANMHIKNECFNFIKTFLKGKYPHIDFDFYLSRRAQNVHMGLNFSLLTLHEY